MEGIFGEIYNILKNIKVLDDVTYSSLLSTYGEKNVNEVIEYMIDENDTNVSKFEYYISKITFVDEVLSTNMFDAYIGDFSAIPCFSKEENQKYIKEIHEIIKLMRKLFVSIGYYSSELYSKGDWIDDIVRKCVELCNDDKKLKELNVLYKKFINKRNILVEGNLRLVISVAKNYYRDVSSFNEFIQLGNLGLIKAVEKYNPKHKALFTTYAYYWIKQSIIRNMPSICYSMNVSHQVVSLNVTMKKVIKRLVGEYGREPTDEEIANSMNISVDKVILLKTTFLDSVSLDEEINGEEDKKLSTLVLEDETVNVANEVFLSSLRSELGKIMVNNLSECEIFVISNRFGLVDGETYTLAELGDKLNLSTERIRQIEKNAKYKLKKKCRNLLVYLRD